MKFFLYLIFLSQLLFSAQNSIGSSFIGLNTGYGYLETKKLGSSTESFDNNPTTYGFEIGYKPYSNFFYSLNYSKYDLDDESIDNVYLSTNYLFDMNHPKYSFYMGVLGGWSSVLDKDSPAASRVDEYLIGVQTGFEFLIKEDFILNISYIFSYSPLENLEVEYTSRHNAVIGFRYFLKN